MTFQARYVMNGKPAAYLVLPAVLGLAACSGSTTPGSDPQSPNPNPKTQAATVVICPDGSAYDPGRNICVATSGAAPSTDPTDEPKGGGQANVRVSCSFNNAWVSVVPVAAYPDDDEFVMQALIGFAEEPDFWSDQSQYEALEQFKAKRCKQGAERFDLQPGSYFVLVGEAGTFQRRGSYNNNGFRKRVTLTKGENLEIKLDGKDLNHTWHCISCPYVSFFDPILGRFLPAFVVLAYRDNPTRRGTDRIVAEHVPVSQGKIRLRVSEVEPEISYLDQLVLEVDGLRVLPSKGGKQSALAQADGVNVMMNQGTEVFVEYDVPHVHGTSATVTVVAHGHYESTSH